MKKALMRAALSDGIARGDIEKELFAEFEFPA